MKGIKEFFRKISILMIIPILVGCGGQKVVGISTACPLPGVYKATVLKATEEGYKDVLVLGSSKYFVEEKIDVGTGWIIGLLHGGEACTSTEEFLHFFEIQKSVYDENQFQITIDAIGVITVKSYAEIAAEEEAAAEAARIAEEEAAAAAAASAAAASSGSSGSSGTSGLKMPVEAPPAPVPVY